MCSSRMSLHGLVESSFEMPGSDKMFYGITAYTTFLGEKHNEPILYVETPKSDCGARLEEGEDCLPK